MVNSNLAYQDIEVETPQIKDDPVKWCSVSLSDVIARGKRLEASVFDVEAIKAYEILTMGKYPAVHLISEQGPAETAYYGGRLKRHYINKSLNNSIGFLGSSEMLDCQPRPVKYMVNDDNAKDVRVEKGTILISRSGTIGNVTYVGETLSNYLVSEHAIRIKCKAFPGYVYAFLKSSIGKKIVCSTQFGAVIQEIEPEHLASIPIPNAPTDIKQRINNLIIDSYRLRDESNELIDNATQLLVDELHLPDISEFEVDDYKKEAPVETFNVKLSDLNGRADASYHLPIVDAIVNHLRKYAEEVTNVGDKRVTQSIVLAGVFKRTYVDEQYGYPFLGGKEITQLAPKTEKYLSKAIHKKRYEKELKVEENTVLVTDRGTIGTVALVPRHWNGYAVSQNVLKAIPTNNNIAGYLFIYLNSDYGRLLVQRQTYGSVVDMIDNNSLASVEFPLLRNKDVQKQINEFALQANQKRYEAYKLEQQALAVMDNEVIFA